MKIRSKTQQIAPLKKKIRGSMPPNPHSKPLPKNSWPPLANPAYAHKLLMRNLFANPPWQTVDCV